jgi:RNA polymerase sigma-70 factor (ECF subfamily)
MPEARDEFLPTRWSLLSRLKDWGDQASWREFFDTYWQLIHRVARKAGLHDDEAQDVVQETILSVAKKMPAFKYDPSQGSFRGWLFQLTRWRILNQFKKRQPQNAPEAPSLLDAGSSRGDEARIAPAREVNRLPSAAMSLEEIPDPAGMVLEALWEEEWRKHVLSTAGARVKALVSPGQYQMFDLYVTQQWPMETVTSTLGVNAAQVYMAKYRISGLIKREIRTLETKMI